VTTATATAIDNFDKTVRSHTAKKVGDTAQILTQIDKIKNSNPPVYEEDKIKVFLNQRAKALATLIDNYMVAKLSSQYPLLDESLFKLKRHLYIRGGVITDDRTSPIKDTVRPTEVPLFIHAPSGDKKVELSKFRRSESQTWGQRRITTTITASVPVVPPNVAEEGRKALAFYYAAMSELYSKPLTSDLLSPDAPPTLETLWIPTVQSMNVQVDVQNIPAPRRYDPALLLNHKGRYYLVGLWEIKEEEPFENLLREFTVGAAKFPKKQ
jgi:hypothetical protein